MKPNIITVSVLTLSTNLLQLSPAGAQQPTPAASPTLEDRVEKLEGNIAAILDILKKQQGAATSPAASAPAPSSGAVTTAPPSPTSQPQTAPSAPAQKPISLKPGAILEVWTLKGDFSGDAPTGRSVGGLLDMGDYFNLLNFTEEPSLASLSSNRLALKWSGLFRAKESGVYVFSLEWSIQRGINRHNVYWAAELAIDEQSLIKESPELSPYNPLAYSASSEVQLEAGGIYPLTLLTFIAARDAVSTTNWDYSKMKLTLKVRGPSDMTPKTITASDLFHK